jgi:DNA-binding MarR family transcriptional regulator
MRNTSIPLRHKGLPWWSATACATPRHRCCGRLGINPTDLRCLDILEREGRIAAGRLAAQAGLTTGAVTLVLDRTEQKGYTRRIRDTKDRRVVFVELTPQGRERIMKLYGPIQDEFGEVFRGYTAEQLAAVADLLERSAAVLADHAVAITAQSARVH